MALTDEQKAIRRTGITGTDIPAIVGEHPFRSPFDVYRSKVEGYEPQVTEDMDRGEFFQEPTAKWYAKKRGAKNLVEMGTIVHPKNKLIIATPDYLATVDGHDIDLSIKVPGPYSAHKWGESGTDDVPEYALLQAQWELLPLKELRGITRGEIAAEVSGALRCYPFETNPELQGILVQAAEKFMRDYVIPRRPPPVDNSESCAKWLAQQWRGGSKRSAKAPAEAEQWAREFFEAKRTLEEAKDKKQEAVNKLASICPADAKRLLGEGWQLTWTERKPGTEVDWEKLWKEELVKRFPSDEQVRLLSKYSVSKDGARFPVVREAA